MYFHNVLEFLSEERIRIKVDRAFQRKSCWSLETKRRFILSFFKRRTPYPIVLASIESGISTSKRIGNSRSLNTYSQLKKQGFNFISLDGQNRTTTLEEFVNNKFQISGTIRDADGVEQQVTNCFYKDLPTRVRDAFNVLNVNVHVMKNCSYPELHEIFVHINDGEGLNEQEKRNAIMTWFSKYIREFSELERSQNLLMKVGGISDQDIRRSKDAEWFSKIFASLTKSNNYTNHSGLDSFYKQGQNRSRDTIDDYSIETVTRFESIIDMVYRSVFCRSSRGVKISQRLLWGLVQVASDVYDSPDGKKIYDYVKFFDIVKEEDSFLCADSQEQFAKKTKVWQINGSGIEPKKSQYYFHWSSDVNKPSVRAKRKNALLSKVKANKQFADCFIDPSNQIQEEHSLEDEIA